MKTIITILSIILGLASVIGLVWLWFNLPAIIIGFAGFATLSGISYVFAIGYFNLRGKKIEQDAQRLESLKIHSDTAALIVPNVGIVPIPNSRYAGNNIAPAVIQAPTLPELQVAPSPLGLPTAPSFADLLEEDFRATKNKMLLGFTHEGPLFGKIDDLLSVAIAGRPGQGKSSLLRFIYSQILQVKGEAAILDVHGSILDDLQGAPTRFLAMTGNELDDAAAFLIDELERRLAQYRRGKRDFTPLMILSDEFPVISMVSKAAVAANQRIILEGRKVFMYGMISGQGLPASNFGGSLARDALSSRYIFKTTQRQGTIAGLDKDSVKLLDTLEVGRCILDGPTDKPTIVAIPKVTGEDIKKLFLPLDNNFASMHTHDMKAAGMAESVNGYSDISSENQSPLRASYHESGSNTYSSSVIDGEYRELSGNSYYDYSPALPATAEELLKAYQAYRAGATGPRSLERALRVPYSKARSLWQELHNKGLIT